MGDSIRCRKGGPLAVTDANLLLGRLIPDYFPKIFGKSENESLDIVASQTAFEVLARKINETQERPFDLDEIVYGWVPELAYSTHEGSNERNSFIKVANETMCRPIRALTEARGYSTGKHM